MLFSFSVCTDTYDVAVVNMFTFGGEAATLSGTATQAKCEETCNLNSGCYGYDWEPITVTSENTPCWIHSSANFAASAIPRTNVNQYRRRCISSE